MIRICKIIADTIIYIIMSIIIIYIFIIGYNKYIKKENIPSINNYYLFQIASGSMEDNLKTGDYIIVKKNNNYKVGDIITYKENNYYITHRIKEINGDKIITRGDANNTDDNPISKEQVLGKMVYRAHIITFFSNHKLFMSIIFIIWIILGFITDKKRA